MIHFMFSTSSSMSSTVLFQVIPVYLIKHCNSPSISLDNLAFHSDIDDRAMQEASSLQC